MCHLLLQPGDAALHGLDEDEIHVWSGDGEHQTGQTRAGPDVADKSGAEKRRDQHGVDDVTRPESRGLQWADEAELLSPLPELRREFTRHVDAVSEQRPSDRRLRLDDDRLRHRVSILCSVAVSAPPCPTTRLSIEPFVMIGEARSVSLAFESVARGRDRLDTRSVIPDAGSPLMFHVKPRGLSRWRCDAPPMYAQYAGTVLAGVGACFT